MGFRFQKRISLFPGLRLNLSKSCVSASVGPRGTDVNIGPRGTFMNAGIPGTGLSYRQKIGGVTHGDTAMSNESDTTPPAAAPQAMGNAPVGGNQRALGWATVIAVVAAVGGGSYWLGHHNGASEAPAASTSQPASTDSAAAPSQAAASSAATAPAEQTYRHRGDDGAGVAAILAAAKPASGMRYVHRNNSALHAQPTYASPLLKKEPKGTTVTLLALSDKWAKIKEGTVEGWMRASVLGENPPGTRKPRKSDSE